MRHGEKVLHDYALAMARKCFQGRSRKRTFGEGDVQFMLGPHLPLSEQAGLEFLEVPVEANQPFSGVTRLLL